MRKTPDTEIMVLVKSIVAGDRAKVREMVTASPGLVRTPAIVGASRQSASAYFFPEIRHYLYGGDTLKFAGLGCAPPLISQTCNEAGITRWPVRPSPGATASWHRRNS